MDTSHVYNAEFMDYAAASSRYAAEKVISIVGTALHPTSVLDVGCAGGAWLAAWRSGGVQDIFGIDGDYVDRSQLLIPRTAFQAADLSRGFDLGRTFDLIQCLEVAEHIEPSAAPNFIESIAKHAGRFVLFSAAPPGQGGEHHVNERPYEYWRSLFASHGFNAFDFVRSLIAQDKRISYWYRYNMILYVRDEHIERLPPSVRHAGIGGSEKIADVSPLSFRIRKMAVRSLPPSVQQRIAHFKAQFFPTGRF